MRRLFLLLTLVLLSLPGATALGSELAGLSKSERAEVLRFAINNSLYTLYHEAAHLLIDKLAMPVLGREEDAADNIATWIMLQKNTPEANQALEDAAEGWGLTADAYGRVFYEEDYALGYSPDRHRAMQIVCLMVGADGAAFRRIANAYAMDTQRQRSCHFEYELIDRSVSGLLEKRDGGTRVTVNYDDSGPSLRAAERLLRSSGIFEDVAEEVRQGYRLEGRVKFTAQQCGEPNAFYDPDTVEVIFCYELMQDFLEIYAAGLPKRE